VIPAAAIRFGAPWARSLAVASAVFVTVSGLLMWRMVTIGSEGGAVILGVVVSIPLLLMIRRYEVAPGELRIRRLLWDTRWPLAGLSAATADPEAMKQSLRTWGNGGLFAVSGHFVNTALGRYRAFVTDPARAVVLRLPLGVVVVSPDRPQEFIAAVTSAAAAGPARP